MGATLLATVESDVLTYPAGYGVVRECLARQEQAVPRSGLARAFGVRPVHPDARSWFGGAIGEMRVGRLLEWLGPEWSVVHSVPVGTRGSDIDHVLVGPPGVFTLNTKRHPGAKIWLGERMLMVAGQKTDHLRNSRHEAERAARLMSAAVGEPVSVRPLVVLVEPGSMVVKRRPTDVVVLTDRQLVRWLSKRLRMLTDAQVQARVDAAARLRTWHKTERVEVDADQAAAFAALRAEDEQARRRRLLWTGGGMLALIAGGVAAAGPAVEAVLGVLAG